MLFKHLQPVVVKQVVLMELQDKLFRRKRLSTGANFVHVYTEIWDKDILKFNKCSV